MISFNENSVYILMRATCPKPLNLPGLITLTVLGRDTNYELSYV